MTTEVILLALIGPYSDPISKLIWALYRRWNMAVVEAHVVAEKKAQRYLEQELLAEGAVLDRLRAKLGPAILDRSRFVVHPVQTASGGTIEDDLELKHAEIIQDTLWTAARQAIERAGPRPVIYGLLADRRRTQAALLSATYQLLARRQDRLVDVRVSDRRVENADDFFFPEQDQPIHVGAITIDPAKVDVLLVDLRIPRLGGLLGREALSSYRGALAAGQAAIDASAPPALVIDLLEGRATVDGVELPLSRAELAWYAFLAAGRADHREGWVVVGQDGHAALRKFLEPLVARPWMAELRTEPLKQLLAGAWVPDEDLRNLRGKTVQKLKQFCARERPAWASWIVPESDGGEHQRLGLPPSMITLER